MQHQSRPIVSATRKPRLLVVDDMPDNLFLMNGLLEDRFEIVQAPSGRDALKVVMSDSPPDMVLLDIMMPDMDGYEVLRRIRQHTPTAHIPIIFVTALASQRDERLGRELGALDYVTKPVDPQKVIDLVDAHVRETLYARRMDELSEKMARQLAPDAWQRLFHGQDRHSIRFEAHTLTLLYAETPLYAAWSERDRESFNAQIGWLVARHMGEFDSFVFGATLAFFTDPLACVRAAMDLQRCAADLRLRIGVDSGDAVIAQFRSEGRVQRTVLGPVAEGAARAASTAATGSIMISPQTYLLVGKDMQADTAGCLVTEEFHDSDVAQACITPMPANTDMSTFAGLGWSH
jgi:CheY-like chemotaxis protein